jgi:hypothetical protein
MYELLQDIQGAVWNANVSLSDDDRRWQIKSPNREGAVLATDIE